MIILICIKQHLSNIWNSIHEKVEQHWGCVAYKKGCISPRLPPLKNLTLENIASIEEFFISWKIYALFSRYSMFCISNHSINCKVSDAMTSICTWERVHFVTYLLYHKSLGHETWPTSRYSYGQYFLKMFWKVGRNGA